MVINYFKQSTLTVIMDTVELIKQKSWEFGLSELVDREKHNNLLLTYNGLKKEWLTLWKRVTGANGEPIYDKIKSRYGEPHRFYHNMVHLVDLFSEFNQVKNELSSPDDVALAIWMHDEIYNTHSKTNERKSAQIAMGRLMGWWDNKYHLCAARPWRAISVYKLIADSTHNKKTFFRDTKYFLDIDLAPLGYSEEYFKKVEKALRKEYEWVSEKMYRETRIDMLKLFLDKKHIYRTERFRDLYETQAKTNLKNSIDMLSK